MPSCPTAPTMPNPGAASTTPDNNDLFYLELKYDALQSGLSGTAAKNGNISQVLWRVRGRERQSYSLTYDHLDRLKTSTYNNLSDAGTNNNSGAWNENLSYDIRGNITSLTRTGKYKSSPAATCWTDGQIDNLSYIYYGNTNRLQQVTDAAPTASKAEGWNNTANATATAQYSYDNNGNMTSDPYKGMSVTYNFLNLPNTFTWGSGSTAKTIQILYDASGRKLRKTVTDGGVQAYRQDYVGGIEYRTTSTVSLSLESIYHPEGRVFNTNTGTTGADALRYEYSIKDHLGNTRLTFTDKNNNGRVDVSTTPANEVLSESHYYPFGLAMNGPWMDDAAARDNQYKYNGKELNSDFGLGWYDYGARWYDASVGRWWAVEPMADQLLDETSYSYALNSPINNIDIDGYIPWPTIVKHRKLGSPFGMRTHPISGKKKGHGGIDLSTDGEGHEVHSAARGKVAYIGWNVKIKNGKREGYGRYVVIEHENGYYSLYAHLRENDVMVKKGQIVANGEVIALSGNTGGSTGPHLHFEIIKANSYKDIFKPSSKIDPVTIEDLDVFLHHSPLPPTPHLNIQPFGRDNTQNDFFNQIYLYNISNKNINTKSKNKKKADNNEKKRKSDDRA